MEANNVVLFPRAYRSHDGEVTQQEVETTVENLRDRMVQEVTTLVVQPLFASLNSAGFPLDDRTMKDGAFLVEAIKSFILKNYSIDHSFQKVANGMFEVDRNNNVKIVGNLKLRE